MQQEKWIKVEVDLIGHPGAGEKSGHPGSGPMQWTFDQEGAEMLARQAVENEVPVTLNFDREHVIGKVVACSADLGRLKAVLSVSADEWDTSMRTRCAPGFEYLGVSEKGEERTRVVEVGLLNQVGIYPLSGD